jgi:hypothetical protein
VPSGARPSGGQDAGKWGVSFGAAWHGMADYLRRSSWWRWARRPRRGTCRRRRSVHRRRVARCWRRRVRSAPPALAQCSMSLDASKRVCGLRPRIRACARISGRGGGTGGRGRGGGARRRRRRRCHRCRALTATDTHTHSLAKCRQLTPADGKTAAVRHRRRLKGVAPFTDLSL